MFVDVYLHGDTLCLFSCCMFLCDPFFILHTDMLCFLCVLGACVIRSGAETPVSCVM